MPGSTVIYQFYNFLILTIFAPINLATTVEVIQVKWSFRKASKRFVGDKRRENAGKCSNDVFELLKENFFNIENSRILNMLFWTID